MRFVKICGVTREEDAYEAGKAGADFIGLIFSPRSPRNIDEENGIRIAEAARKANAIPVTVFTHASAHEMERIADLLGVHLIQLHSDFAIAEGMFIKAARIFVNPKSYHGIDEGKDYIMFDSKDGNYGPLFPGKNDRWFLAGGLTPRNVSEAIKKYNPPGLDVAGGVESSPGVKDLKLVKEFINLVKNG